MIPWLIVIVLVLATLAVMHFVNGKPQERKILMGLFAAVFLLSCVAIFLDGYLGGNSGWVKTICFALNLVVLLRIDDAKKKKRKR